MMEFDVKVHIDDNAIRKIHDAELRAIHKTAVKTRDAIVKSDVMPVDTGRLKDSTTVYDGDQGSRITTEVPYAAKQYFNPENLNNHWLDPWLNGLEKQTVVDNFAKEMRKELRKL